MHIPSVYAITMVGDGNENSQIVGNYYSFA